MTYDFGYADAGLVQAQTSGRLKPDNVIPLYFFMYQFYYDTGLIDKL
jgi:hypothetical protein